MKSKSGLSLRTKVKNTKTKRFNFVERNKMKAFVWIWIIEFNDFPANQFQE
jgi:hypothetical protein